MYFGVAVMPVTGQKVQYIYFTTVWHNTGTRIA